MIQSREFPMCPVILTRNMDRQNNSHLQQTIDLINRKAIDNRIDGCIEKYILGD